MPITLPDARLPDGLRVYAIGDVHGERDAAAQILDRITADLACRPTDDWREVWLGDLIDRGPDSAGVMDLANREADRARRTVLLGNHDAFLRDFLAHAEIRTLSFWLDNGGVQACLSWGLDAQLLEPCRTRQRAADFRDRLAAAITPAQHALLAGMPTRLVLGDFAFVHAGIRPGVPFADQHEDDLIWIRHEFLYHPGPHDHVVVHGHTPRPEIEVMPQRIGIDTGCGKGGTLSCVVIENGLVAALEKDGPVPLL
ncbi:MAG: metallophosphoesterase [Pseudomonadota bacterium]